MDNEQLEKMMRNGFKVIDERLTAMEACLSQLRGSNFKIDYKAKLKASPELLAALNKTADDCLPLQKTGKFKNKEGKEIIFAVIADYQEASSNALKSNKITITFDEDESTMELTTNVILLPTNEIRSIKTQVEPTANPDQAKAKWAGFQKAKGKMLANLLNLDKKSE